MAGPDMTNKEGQMDHAQIMDAARARVAHLEPLVREHAALTRMLAGQQPARPAAQLRAATTRRARARQRTPRGANRDAVLNHLRALAASDAAAVELPGAADLQRVTGINRGVLYNLLTRLVEQGELVREPGEDGNARYWIAP